MITTMGVLWCKLFQEGVTWLRNIEKQWSWEVQKYWSLTWFNTSYFTQLSKLQLGKWNQYDNINILFANTLTYSAVTGKKCKKPPKKTIKNNKLYLCLNSVYLMKPAAYQHSDILLWIMGSSRNTLGFLFSSKVYYISCKDWMYTKITCTSNHTMPLFDVTFCFVKKLF